MFLQLFMPRKKNATDSSSTATKKASKSAPAKKTAVKKESMKPRKATSKKAPTKKATKQRTTAAASKKTARKTSSKKPATSSQPLVYADDARSFWTSNGEVLNSLLALRDALERMDKQSYAHHVTPEKNDFAMWVSDVLCDPVCADELNGCTTPRSARTVVVRRLRVYEL